MTFPAGLTTITVTGQNLLGFGGAPLSGVVIFTPSGVVTAVPAEAAVLEGSALAQVSAGSIVQPFVIVTTDCVSPGFTYTITFRLQTPEGMSAGLTPVEDVAIPSTLGASIDLSELLPGSPPPAATAFTSDNTWTGVQTFGGSPPLIIPDGAAAGDVLTSDASGHGTWQPPTGGGGGGGISPPAGDLGGTALAPTVTGTHLASPLPVAQGGTGQATQQAALDALAGAHTSGLVLRGNGTHVVLAAIQAADVPTLNQATTGNAGTATNLAGGATLPAYLAPKAVTLTDESSVAVDASLGNYYQLLLTSAVGGSRTIAAPSSALNGDSFVLSLQQPASGGPCVPAFASGAGGYSFGADSTPSWSTTAGAVDEIGFRYHGGLGKWLCQGWKLGFS